MARPKANAADPGSVHPHRSLTPAGIHSWPPPPPVPDILFHVTGAEVPADHGYALFGAISRILESDGGPLAACQSGHRTAHRPRRSERPRPLPGEGKADAGDHILQPAPVAVVVEHLGGGGQRNGEAAAQRRQAPFDRGVVRQPVARDQPVEAVGERLPELDGALPPAGRGAPGQQPAALPEGDQTAGVGARLLPSLPGTTLGAAAAREMSRQRMP